MYTPKAVYIKNCVLSIYLLRQIIYEFRFVMAVKKIENLVEPINSVQKVEFVSLN